MAMARLQDELSISRTSLHRNCYPLEAYHSMVMLDKLNLPFNISEQWLSVESSSWSHAKKRNQKKPQPEQLFLDFFWHNCSWKNQWMGDQQAPALLELCPHLSASTAHASATARLSRISLFALVGRLCWTWAVVVEVAKQVRACRVPWCRRGHWIVFGLAFVLNEFSVRRLFLHSICYPLEAYFAISWLVIPQYNQS